MVTCPQCLGNKKLLDFRAGDKATGESAGWKAVDCPECKGKGEVPEAEAPAIEERIHRRIEEAKAAEKERRGNGSR